MLANNLKSLIIVNLKQKNKELNAVNLFRNYINS